MDWMKKVEYPTGDNPSNVTYRKIGLKSTRVIGGIEARIQQDLDPTRNLKEYIQKRKSYEMAVGHSIPHKGRSQIPPSKVRNSC